LTFVDTHDIIAIAAAGTGDATSRVLAALRDSNAAC
jgi:hypothetical protein